MAIKTSTIMVCDRCGNVERLDDVPKIKWVWSTVVNQNHYDFCERCKSDLDVFMNTYKKYGNKN